jgi:hypothetical protein
MKYKRAFIKVVVFLFSRLILFSSQGKPARAHMYPKAAIKSSFPKNLRDYRVKIANKVSSIFNGRPDARKQSPE